MNTELSMFPRATTGIKIKRLMLQQTGTYNNLYLRPYTANIDGSTINTITNRIESNGNRITGSLLSGISANIIQPSATPEAHINIPNGWNEIRVRFVLEVECNFNTGGTIVYFFQGYTNYYGVSTNGYIDPNMVFYINSVNAVNCFNTPTLYGVTPMYKISDACQVISDPNWGLNTPENIKYSMRPMDLFSSMQTNHFEEAFNYHGADSFSDTRCMIRNDPIKSTRKNNIPSQYLTRMIDGYNTAVLIADYGQSEQDVYNTSRNNLYEDLFSENPFIKELCRVAGIGFGSTNCFSFSQLELVDPNARQVTSFIAIGETQKAQLHQAGLTNHWHGSDRETVAATVLSHSVPAVMMELLISKVSLRSTNYDLAGQMNTVLYSVKSLTNTDLTRNYDAFIHRLEKEIIFDLTYGNQEPYMLDMQVDLFGETWIKLSIGNSSQTDFVTPTFCDNLFAPVVTSNVNNLSMLANDCEQLVRHCSQHSLTPLALDSISHSIL